jgi:phosphoglycolate phosphatase
VEGRVRAVVFDLDGTLVHSAPDLHAAANRMLEEIGEAPLTLAEVTSFVGNGIPVLVDRVMAARGLAPDRHAGLLARYMAHYRADPATLATLMPGVRAALDAMAAAGVPMAICTNKPEAPTRDMLATLGIAGAFDAVVGGDTLPVKKPDPGPLLRAAGMLAQDFTLFVGDSEVDAETARRAGMAFALYTGGYRNAPAESLPQDARFDDFAALPGLLDRLAPLPACG